MGLMYWLKISASEMVKLKTVKPFARMEYGRISTVYETMRGVNARLVDNSKFDVTVVK